MCKLRKRLQNGSFPSRCLIKPTHSPFMQVYRSNNLEAMIKMTGFDYSTFHDLVDKLTPFCNLYTPHVYIKGGFIIKKKKLVGIET